jgi:hypothetical protein
VRRNSEYVPVLLKLVDKLRDIDIWDTDLVGVMEREDDVRPAWSLQDSM